MLEILVRNLYKSESAVWKAAVMKTISKTVPVLTHLSTTEFKVTQTALGVCFLKTEVNLN